MLALYKAGCGLFRPVRVVIFDLTDDTIGIEFVRCFNFRYVTSDKIIPWDANLVDTAW